jgi:hypothetical protein
MNVRWALYSGCLPDGTALALPGIDLQRHCQRWWVYHANDLTHICFETLLKYVLDALEGHPGGIRLARLIADCVADIMASANPQPKNWAAFLDEIAPALNASSSDSPIAEATLAQRIMNAARPDQFCGTEDAYTALRLLATLHNRVRASAKDIKEELGAYDPSAFRSLLTELSFLENHMQAEFVKTVAGLIEERVIRRHLWIALRKLRYQGDYTFLIETDDGRVRLREKDGPVFTNPRLAPTLTFLKDIDLLDENGLTALGHQQIGPP